MTKIENLLKQILIERYMIESYAGFGFWVKDCVPSPAITELYKELGIDIPHIERQDCGVSTHEIVQHSHEIRQHAHSFGDDKTAGI